MRQIMTAVVLAVGSLGMAMHAQETTIRTETERSGGQAQTMIYTGCVQTGTQSRTYVLDRVVPVTRTTTTDLRTGNTESSTAYMLVPGDRVEIQQHVGRKVEVTGTLIPAGEVTTETEIEVEREDGDDSETRQVVESETTMPQFRVTSIKTLNESC